MFGKTMSLPDDLIALYFELLTDMPDEEVDAIRSAIEQRTTNPMDFKKRLGGEMVTTFHSPEAAVDAREEFERRFQQREFPHIPETTISATTLGVMSIEGESATVDMPKLIAELGMVTSRSEGRRLILGGAIRINGEVLHQEMVQIGSVSEVKVGNRRFIRLRLET